MPRKGYLIQFDAETGKLYAVVKRSAHVRRQRDAVAAQLPAGARVVWTAQDPGRAGCVPDVDTVKVVKGQGWKIIPGAREDVLERAKNLQTQITEDKKAQDFAKRWVLRQARADAPLELMEAFERLISKASS